MLVHISLSTQVNGPYKVVRLKAAKAVPAVEY